MSPANHDGRRTRIDSHVRAVTPITTSHARNAPGRASEGPAIALDAATSAPGRPGTRQDVCVDASGPAPGDVAAEALAAACAVAAAHGLPTGAPEVLADGANLVVHLAPAPGRREGVGERAPRARRGRVARPGARRRHGPGGGRRPVRRALARGARGRARARRRAGHALDVRAGHAATRCPTPPGSGRSSPTCTRRCARAPSTCRCSRRCSRTSRASSTAPSAPGRRRRATSTRCAPPSPA